MKYKMVVCDFDGTLYRSDYTVSAANAASIRKYTAGGGKFVIATGRLFQGIRKEAAALGLKGEIIAYQGTGIYDIESGAELYSMAMDNVTATRLLRFAYEKIGEDKCVPMLYYNDECYTKSRNEYIDMFSRIVGIEAAYTGCDIDEFLGKDKKPHKVLLMSSPREIDKIAESIRARFDSISVTKSSAALLEIVEKGQSKATAIDWLRNRYGIERSEIIAIGDSENDIPMIEYAGLGVAVGNAMESVRNIADYIAPSNDEDGVKHVIEKFCG